MVALLVAVVAVTELLVIKPAVICFKAMLVEVKLDVVVDVTSPSFKAVRFTRDLDLSWETTVGCELPAVETNKVVDG